MTPDERLSGASIRLVRLRESDKETVGKWMTDKAVARRIWLRKSSDDPLPEITPSVLDRLFNHLLTKTDAFAVECGELGTIGYIGLKPASEPQQRELFIVIGAKRLWGRGAGTAAVGKIMDYCRQLSGVKALTAEVFAFNPAGCRILEKCGFRYAGPSPEKAFHAGSYHEVKRYELSLWA